MEEKAVELKIDQALIKPIIEKRIQAAVVAGLGDAKDYIDKLVELALKQKVNGNGKVDNYSFSNKYDFLDILCKTEIQKAAREALDEWIKGNIKLVKQAVLKELNSPKRQKSIAKAFANAVEESLNCKWRMNCDISFKEIEKD